MKHLVPIFVLIVACGTAWSQWSLTGLQVKPYLDVRAQASSGEPTTLRVMQSEVDIRISVTRKGEEFASVALEPAVSTVMEGRGRQMHYSNYYSVFNFGVGKPKLKVGQFVVPFGTLAEYDTHPLVLQTPYARTLGIRIDRGLGLETLRGKTDFRMSVTSGDGRTRHDNGYAITARVARDYERGNDTVRVGLSGMYGHGMPVFKPLPDPIPMALDMQPAEWVNKGRLAVDLDWLHSIDNIRAEFVIGWDQGSPVHGEWVLFNHPFSYNTEFTVQADQWHQPSGSVAGFGVELHHRLDDFSGLRLTGEHRRATTAGEAETLSTLTLQYYRNFDLRF
jgi:hypothetical protein